MAGDARVPGRLIGAAVLLAACVWPLAACNTDAPWRRRPAEPAPARSSAPPTAAASSSTAPDHTSTSPASSDDPALDEALGRVAWARVRWPGGEVIAVNEPARLDEPVTAGSLFKVIVARAAIEQGVATPGTRIVCPRRVEVQGRRVDCVHPELGRPLTLEDALAHSCNHFFVQLADRLDLAHLTAALRRLSDGRVAALGSAPLPLVVLGLEGPRQGMRGWMRTVLATLHDPPDTTTVSVPLRRALARAATEGTAQALGDAHLLTFAKTGTTMASATQDGRVVAWRPEIGEVVVVRAAGISGRDAARLASHVWTLAARDGMPTVRVGRVRASPDRATLAGVDAVPLEAYVAGVVAAEGEASMPGAVLEALAVAARSYARAPERRHAREGYDVCDTTHCQVFGRATAWSEAAAAATRALVLTHDGRVAAVPYSASCPGALVSPRALWGGSTPVVTAVGAEPGPHAVAAWDSDVTEAALTAALRDVGLRGERVRDLRVVERRDGVPVRIVADGLTPAELPATTFRVVVGRRLGWHVLKSDAWTVRRTARGYRFTGHGKGHGAGLCLAGATTLATRGLPALRLLGAYAPATQVWSEADQVTLRLPSALLSQAGALQQEARALLATLRLRLGVFTPRTVLVEVHPTPEAYQRATGRAWWTGASTRWLGGSSYRVDVAPARNGQARAALTTMLAHEFVHVLTAAALQDAPAWVSEGLAGLAPRTSLVEQVGSSGPCPADADIHTPGGLEAMRTAYARAEACVKQALPAGVASWRRLAY